MKVVRVLVLTIVVLVALCGSVFSGEPTPAPYRPGPTATDSPGDEAAGRAPILIMAHSIRIASSLDRVDVFFASLAGEGEPDRSLIIRCDKIEVVRGNRGSAPEMECFGDVMVTDSTLSIQAERVQKRGKTLIFEGSSGKPVQIIKKSGDKAVSRITAAEVTVDLPANQVCFCAVGAARAKRPETPFNPR
ncbi:MAG: hypothetical protein ACLQNE_11885 [Thermoguttaceae bacterium]